MFSGPTLPAMTSRASGILEVIAPTYSGPPSGAAGNSVTSGTESAQAAAISVGVNAPMIGGTRQSVNRLLNDFVDQGLLRVEKESVVIPDLERLARAAER